jgi:hypothetical protein
MDARVVELINLELDGRLDAAGRAELEAALANDPAARARREQLRAVARALADAPVPSLPLDFREAVLRRLPQRSNRARRVRTAWRVGLALAASVVAAVAVVQLVPQGPSEQMGATLAPATARVSAAPQADGLALDFVLPAGPAQLVIDLPGTGALSATTAGGPAPVVEGRRIVVAAAGGRIRVQVAGDVKEFTASLVRDGVVTPVTVQSP